MYSISFIGAGNVSYQLALALQRAGCRIDCVYNRNIDRAEKVVRALKREKSNAFATDNYSNIPQSDIIIIAVSDSAIEQVIEQLKDRKQFIVHTSGATPLNVFEAGKIEKYGVFYPLMTISINKSIDIKLVPFLLEASSKEQMQILQNLTTLLKAEYKVCSSDERQKMHTAAVFATNFINYMLQMAYEVTNPDFTFLLPSAIETVRKAFLNRPDISQTGPAVRGDMQTINKHLQLLKNKGFNEQYEVYKTITQKIIEKYKPEEK